MGLYLLTLIGLLFILVRENPFVMLKETPVDGAGLNPLLQDDWMVIHPPIMFIGFAATAVPFAFAMAALWRREYDGWAARAFPWALGGFLVLGTAILMGGYWAYKTLGWGGYWGWDPVENASLIPWIFGTVMIHGLHMERAKGRYRRANYVLAWLTYLSVLYGTFLTRSGVLADFSVHSFVDLGISGWLIALLAVFILLPTWLLIDPPARDPDGQERGPVPVARHLHGAVERSPCWPPALVITVGTSAPLLTRFLDDPGQVGPEFYNRVNLPIALLVAFLLACVPYLTWRGNQRGELLRKLVVPGVFALVVDGRGGESGRCATPSTCCSSSWLRWPSPATSRRPSSWCAARAAWPAAGGYLAHVGVGVILLGFIASSGYDQSAKVTLEQGVAREVDGLTLTFNRFLPRTAEEKERMEILVEHANGSTYLAYPKFFLNDRTRQLMVNPDIKTTPLQDLYISPIEYDPGQPVLELARGASGEAGEIGVRFADFDLQVEGNALAKMAAGEPMTIGADLEITRGGRSQRVKALYRMNPTTGQVETPPTSLPGGGEVTLTGINAQAAPSSSPSPASATRPKLSIDVTRKPLIKLVWYGLYVVLLGGALATVQRFRQARKLEREGVLAARKTAAYAPTARRSARSGGRPARRMRSWARSTA